MHSRLQEYLKTAYSVNSERIEAIATAGEKRRAEVRWKVWG